MSKPRRNRTSGLARPESEVVREYEDLAARQYANGKVDRAVETLTKLLTLYPTRIATLQTLANLLADAGQLEEAAEVLLVLKEHLPQNGDVRAMLGSVFARMRLLNRAEEELTAAAQILPQNVQIKVLLAQVYEQWGREEPAVEHLSEAVKLKPEDRDLAIYAAGVLHHAGRDEDSRKVLHGLFPDAEAVLLDAMQMPVIARSVGQIADNRKFLSETLARLREEGARIPAPSVSGHATCFQLGYHGLEDRPLIEDVAFTQLSLSPELGYVSPDLERPPVANRKLSIGFLSANMRTHSVGRVLNRFLKELDRERFDVTLLELPGKYGGGQETARGMADRAVFVPADLLKARQVVEAERLDVLVHPDFVMDPFHDLLAYSRLAPVQVTTWGHPGTSGRPSMDYWISCNDWEPAGNERLYTEKLVRFSSPPMIATRLDWPESITGREALGLPEGRIYGCPQSLYKLHPEFDEFLAEVLRRDPQGWVVLIGGIQQTWIDVFLERFKGRFADVADRLILLRNLATNDYLSLLSHCEVSLDPIHFGGANTSMEAFTMGVPVVTLPGGQLRNRQTLSFYRMMEFEDLIVDSLSDYVDLALRIGQDRAYRDELSRIVKERCGVLFDTVEVTRELEGFFESAAREAISA
ncbi:MAG TPA: tetratricopeptide repeat protein [Fimbriimonas sp.]|nr:tetratricopeptide repeat protein [Fimbriimonas sp.]